jgi:hypothetical protein
MLEPLDRLMGGSIRLTRNRVEDPATRFLRLHQAALSQDRQMLGDSRRRKLQQLGNLADAQLATCQSDESPDTAFVRQSIGNGKHFSHGFTSIVISPYNEMYSGIMPLVKRVLGTAVDKREQSGPPLS